MKLVTFTGQSPTEALSKARSEFGDDISVVSTKEIRKKTLTQSAMYEVVVVVEDELAEKYQAKINPKRAVPNPYKQSAMPKDKGMEDDVVFVESDEYKSAKSKNSISDRLTKMEEEKKESYKQAEKLERMPDSVLAKNIEDSIGELSRIVQEEGMIKDDDVFYKTPQDSVKADVKIDVKKDLEKRIDRLKKEVSTKESSVNSSVSDTSKDIKELRNIKDEMDKLNDKLKLIQNMFWNEKAPRNQDNEISIPQEFAEIYRISKSSGMNENHISEIMKLTDELMPINVRDNSAYIKKFFKEVLKKMILIKEERLEEKKAKVIMLMGPTGVGKTTTLAKLAARYSRLMDKSYKVGIITLDTYRIGAVDQLMFYARKMRLSIDTVSDPSELEKTIEGLSNCDYILVDTAGSSQFDMKKIDYLKQFSTFRDKYHMETSLVVSAGSSYDDLVDIYNTFNQIGVDNVIFSKLDETRGYGNIFSFVYDIKKPISYLSVGQEVPNDIKKADSEFIANCMMYGFSDNLEN